MKTVLLTENEYQKVKFLLKENEEKNGLVGFLYTDDLYKAIQESSDLEDFLDYCDPKNIYDLAKDDGICDYAGIEYDDGDWKYTNDDKKEQVKKDLTDLYNEFNTENFKFYEGYLELSDRRVMWELEGDEFDKDLYEDLCNQAIEDFQDEFSEELHILGRGNRHVCVENCFENAAKYEDMKKFIESALDDVVKNYNDFISKQEEE